MQRTTRHTKKRRRVLTKQNKRTRSSKGRYRAGAGNLSNTDNPTNEKNPWTRLKNNIRNNTGFLLKKLCPDSGVCIALGTYKDYIKRHFGNFTNPTYLNSVSLIETDSINGIIFDLEYSKNEYVIHAVLKIPQNNVSSDNIVFEALVGFFLNTQSLKFPSFVETYGLYDLRNNLKKHISKDIINTNGEKTDCLKLINNMIELSIRKKK
jgi:hypothetical protein